MTNIFFDNCLAVFQGGGCKALAYIGAYKSALEKGVHFNELAGTSAGSIIAALIAAGATPKQLEDFAGSIRYKKLFCPKWYSYIVSLLVIILALPLFITLLLFGQWKIINIIKVQLIPLLRELGMYSTQPLHALLEPEMQRLTGLNREVVFEDLIPDLHVVSSDIIENKEKIWNKENTPNESVVKAVCASCAIPLFFQPVENRYVDGGILSNAPIHIFASKPNYSKILSFQIQSKGKQAKGIYLYIKRLIATIIDGAVSLQNSFGIEVYPISIDIQNLDATDFDKIDKKKIDELKQNGISAFEKFWKENNVQDSEISVNALNKTISSYEQIYTLVSTYSHREVSEVFVSCSNTKWVWVLFPTILKWVRSKATIVVYAPEVEKQDQSNYAKEERTRRNLLNNLGIPVENKDNLNVNGFFLQHKTKQETQWKGVFYSEKSDEKNHNEKIFLDGCYYDHKLDGKAIEAWVGKLRIKNEKKTWDRLNKLEIKPIDDNFIYSMFQELKYYAYAEIRYESINIKDVLFLNHHIRLGKYRQIDILFGLYETYKIPLFKAAELSLLHGKTNLIGPIVIERHEGKMYVIEGNTRLAYAYNKGITTIHALVIEKVQVPLPIAEGFTPCNVDRLLITDSKKNVNEECNKYFRHIEAQLHPTI